MNPSRPVSAPRNPVHRYAARALPCAALLLAACGGGGGGGGGGDGSDSGSDSSYMLTATLSGLPEGLEVTAQVNSDAENARTLDHTDNEQPRSFPEELADGTAYEVTIAAQPNRGHCTVINGTGTIDGSDVGDIRVRCSRWAVADEFGDTWAIRDVAVVDQNTAVAVSNIDVIRRTADGGDSWTAASDVPELNTYFYGVTYDDNSGRLFTVSSDGHVLYSTSNFGDKWTEAATPSGTNDLRAVTFADTGGGWAVGWEATILYSDDSGGTWQNQTSDVSGRLWDVDFGTNGQKGLIVGWKGSNMGGLIQRTTDGGTTWNKVDVSAQDPGPLRGVWLSDDGTTAWAVGSYGMVLYSEDGGASWSRKTVGTTASLRDVMFVPSDEQTGWIVGEDSTILHTTDAGTNWSHQGTDLTTHLFGIDMFDAESGFAVGGRDGTRVTLRYE